MRVGTSIVPPTLLLLGALSAGCGDDDDSPSGESGAPSSSSATSETQGDPPSTSAASSSDPQADTSTSETPTSETGTSSTTGAPFEGRLLVTADWRNKSLTLVDFEALATGATTRDEIVVGEVDLGDWEPGPLQVELTPDGRRAVVAISPGFFDGVVGGTVGAGDVPLEGALLVVDLASREVVADLVTAHVPMGIAITPDSSTAYTANYGHSEAPGNTLSVVDLDLLAVTDDIEVGARPEQVTLSDDGLLGILNLAGDGAVVVFDPADIAGTLSAPLMVSEDPSDVDFIEGTQRAVVANSADPFTYTVIDISDPATPTFVAEGTESAPFPYGLTRIPGTTEFLMTIATNPMRIVRADGNDPEGTVWSTAVKDVGSFPLGIAVDPGSGLAFVGAAGANVLVVQPLDGSAARTLDWLPESGPTYVALGPA